MAKRNKTKKLFKSNLKLEALEQRQLLAGISGSGTELTPGGAGANNFITASNGNHYDQVLLTGTSLTVTNDVGNITRVSFLDLQGDIVQAEFGGAGTLTISLDTNTAVPNVAPAKYNQTGVAYEQGLASFSIQGSDATTNFTVFSVGAGTAFAGNTLFDSTHTGGNNVADVQRLTIVANPANPNGSTFGGIRAGNAIFGAASGQVGISAANVQVQDVVTVGDIKATGTATPTLVFGTQSQFGAVTVAGGGLVEANGASINDTGSYKFGLTFASGADSTVAPGGTPNLPAQTAPAGLSFTGDNPIAAQVKTFTLTTGVDTIVGSGGNDAINGQINGGSVTDTLSLLDSIDGGAGTDSLSISDLKTPVGSGLPGGITIKNVEVLNLGAAGTAVLDSSAITGLTTLNVLTSTGADNLTAGASQAVTVFDTAGLVTLVGGSTQTVTTAGGVKLTKATGAITVTDTAQAAQDTNIDDGTALTLTNTATRSGGGTTGAINVGVATKPTGVIAVTNTITGDATSTATVTGGIVTVNGGTTVTVTNNATPVVDPVVNHTSQQVTLGAVNVTGAAGITTAVTVNQTTPVSAVATATAVVATTEVSAVTFTGLTAGQSVKLAGVTYVAPAGGASADKVAAAFANLPSGGLSGYSSSAVSGAGSNIVTFTATGTGAKLIAVGGDTLVDTVTFVAVPAVSGSAVAKTVTIAGLTYDDGIAANNTAAGGTGVAGSGVTAIGLAGYFQSILHTNASALAATSSVTAAVNNATAVAAGLDWSSGLAAANVVVFSATTSGISDSKLSIGGSNTTTGTSVTQAAVTVASVSPTVAGVDKQDAGGKGAVVTNSVTVLDGNYTAGGTNTIASVSLSNYKDSTISSNALTSLTLTNNSAKGNGSTTGALTINNSVATTLDLTVSQNGSDRNIGNITNAGAAYTTLKVHVPTANATMGSFTDSALTSLTVDGSKVLKFSAPASVTTIAVSGAAGLNTTAGTNVTDVNASATSGAMTVTLSNAATTYEGGSGADNVSIAAAPTKAISGGAGTDTITVTASNATIGILSANAFVSGFETLATDTNASGNFDATGFTGLSNGIASITFSNVATGTPLTVTGGSTTYTLKDDGGAADTLPLIANGGTTTVTASGNIEAVTINDTDDSTITLTAAKATSVTVTGSKKLTLTSAAGNIVLATVDASLATGALTHTTNGTVVETVKGGTAGDSLTAATGTTGDVLSGFGGNDTLTANKGLDTLTGGSGNDTFVIPVAGSNLNAYTVITDASVGDVIQLKNVGNEVFNATKVPLQNTAVFLNFANTVVNDGFTASGDASANAQLGWFQFNGDTYIVESMHNANPTGGTPGFMDGTDLVVKLAGLVDLSAASFVQNGNAPEIIIR